MSKHAKNSEHGSFLKNLNIIVIGLFFVGVSICLLVLERPTLSELEKRELTEMPKFTLESYFSGDFTDQITEHYDDTVPNRDAFKQIAGSIRHLSNTIWNALFVKKAPVTEDPGNTSIPEVTPTPTPQLTGTDVSSETKPTPTPSPTPEPTIPPNPYENETLIMSNGIAVVGNRGMELFGGSYDIAKTYAETLNQYKLDLGENVNVYSMAIPLSCAFYLPQSEQWRSVDQKEIIAYQESLFKNVMNIDAYSVLMLHRNENIYLRTDHHWAPTGAYYAAQLFAAQSKVPFADLSTYTKEVYEGFKGTMYVFSDYYPALNDPEEFVRYLPNNQYSVQYFDTYHNLVDRGTDSLFFETYVNNMYGSVMGGDSYITEIKTDVKNGRKLVIFKDSYGNALVPYLTGSYEEISVVDVRNFDINAIEYIKSRGATDVLFASCVFTSCGTNCQKIVDIRTQ